MPSIGKRLACRSGGLSIYTVDGPQVRDRLCVEFAAGGHGHVYRYVPKTEVWIERINTRRDQRMVLAHELIELEYMKRKGWTYARAHALANEMEDCLRHGARRVDTIFYFLRAGKCYPTQEQALRAAQRLAGILAAF